MSITFTNVPVSIFKGTSMNGGVQRRLFITVEDLNSIPEELFKVKISQSKNPALAGKTVFKYFTYKVNENTAYSPLAPDGTTLATPLSELKNTVISKLGVIPGVKFTLTITLNGQFAVLTTPQGDYKIFDNAEWPETDGDPTKYYFNNGTPTTVTLTEHTSEYAPYYRVRLETAVDAEKAFTKKGQRAKAWVEDDEPTGSDFAASDAATDAGDANPGIW